MWNNPSVHRVNICRYDWLHRQADWPIAEQGNARRESQTDKDRMRKGGVREGHQPDAEQV